MPSGLRGHNRDMLENMLWRSRPGVYLAIVAAVVATAAVGAWSCGGASGEERPERLGPTGGSGGTTGSGGPGGAGGVGAGSMSGPGSGGGSTGDCSEAGSVSYPSPTTEDVSFTSSVDGVQLFGRLHIPEPGGSFATVVLLHQVCADQTDWTVVSSLAPDLAAAGFLVLHYDARGHGQSDEGGSLDLCGETGAPLFEPMVGDVGDAIAFLETRAEADLGCLGVAGGSLGANVALIYGATDDRVRTTVMLSPGLNYLGLSTQTAMGDFDPRPSLMMATADDDYSVNTMSTLSSESSVAMSATFPGDAHGASILAAHPDALAQTLAWFGDHL